MSGRLAGKTALISGVASGLSEPQENLSLRLGTRVLAGDLSSVFGRKTAAAILDAGDEARR